MRGAALPLVLLSGLAACGGGESTPLMVGQLESDRVEVAFDVAEVIVERGPREGSVVTAGTTLFRQRSDLATAEVAAAEANVAMRRAELDELLDGTRREQLAAARADLEGARKELGFRRTERSRIAELAESNLVSRNALDSAKAAFDRAEAAFESATARLDELVTGARSERIAAAAARVAAAEATLERARIELARHTVAAPVAAVLDRYLYEIGERPSAGSPAAVLLAGEQPYARIYVPAALRARISTGTALQVYVDGIDAPIDGRVRWVSDESTFTPYFALTRYDRGRLSYVAEVELAAGDERLPDGVPLEAAFGARPQGR